MTVTTLAGSLTCGITGKRCERRPIREVFEAKTLNRDLRLRHLGANYWTGLRSRNVVGNCGLVSGELALDYDLGSSNGEEMLASTRESLIHGSSEGYIELTGTSTSESDPRSVQNELIMLSLPAIAGQAIEPLAQLMETAYIGRMDERKPLPSVSTALLLAVGIGICEALALYLGSGLFLNMMGLSTTSSMRIPAERFLKLRAFGAPAVVVSLAIQGIFRGFKDTKTPVLCLGGFLLGRTLAAVMTITLSTSMAARQGPLAMAAHQICLQVWLSVSLLADAQAASGQALIASYFAKGDYSTVREITFFALKFVSASQPVNALAYIFDGLHYGVSDFSFASYSMMIVGAISSAFLLYSPILGLSGVWFGLTLFMGLRTVAGYMR
ncbi:MATE efflux family protein [Actinidia rufa]|uniref:MATE efflux family protein n=1 Tax=Actinidia rufa TaxID=165716 RepID=A0A7J0DQU6_9ERIC|nr:MATE efflux family protein [Actinidia rufa]